jgi:hypothetical protein
VSLLQSKEAIKVKLNMNIKIQYDAGNFSVNTKQISNLTKQEHNKSCVYEIIVTLYIKKCEEVKTIFRRKITKKK